MPQQIVTTPIGPVLLEGDGRRLTAVRLRVDRAMEPGDWLLAHAAEQITLYFSGRLRSFDLPLTPTASPRGQALRDGIAAIGWGETRSYGALAHAIGSGPRAIGQACARNPFPIVIPCHRVVAADGPGHYSGGGGLETKLWLLAHETRGGENGYA